MTKGIFVGIALCLLLTMTLCQQADFFATNVALAESSQPREAMPNLQGQPAIDYLKRHGLYERIQQTVEGNRHAIRWQSNTDREGGGWKTKNPGQNIDATFSTEGALITPGQSCDSAAWRVALTLRSVGYGKRLNGVVSGPMQVNSNRVELQKFAINSESGVQTPITEWYVNKPEGIEQGFTLAERPERTFGVDPLRLEMSVKGGLEAKVGDSGKAIALSFKNGRQVLRYDHLVAYDALGRTLPSRMEVTQGAIALLVEDENAVYPVTIDPVFAEIKKLTASDGAAGDLFGKAVAISGDTAIVTAYGDEGGKGAAYIFERNKTGADLWGEVKKIVASDGVANDFFGWSVAISGDTAVVGAYRDDSFKGSAYVFERNKTGADAWGEVKKLTASDGAGSDLFGYSVGISGNTAIVGAYGDETQRGAAYIFERNKTGADLWGEVKKLTASDGVASDLFGFSVSISADTAIVGMPQDDSFRGAAYVYERNKTGADLWGEVKKIVASDGAASDNFGYSVAISGDTALVGAFIDDSGKGSAYIFERNKTGADLWGEVRKLTASDGVASDQFGFSVALSGDTAIVGTPRDEASKGSAYIYERNKGGADLWGEVKKLTASDGVANDSFAVSLGISGDTVVVGVPGDDGKGAAYIFATDCTWAERRKPVASDGAAPDRLGVSVSISGDTAIVGAYLDDFKGSAYIFERNKTGADLWGEVRKLTASDAASGDNFGYSVGISGDTAIVGAYVDDNFKGSAYIYERNKGGADLWGEVKKLTASDGASTDSFGVSVGISGDTAIIGAYLDDTGQKGSAYIFGRNQGGADNWGEIKKLSASDGGPANDNFGYSVGISGDTAIVGAPRKDSAKGAAYIFARNTGGANNWGEVKKLTATDGVASDFFGISVGISGDTAIVAAYLDDGQKGSAWIFERNKGGADLWGEVKKLSASDGVAGDSFGNSVGISGDTAIVGAAADDSVKGSAYIFERNKNGADLWGEVKKLTASDGATADGFGVSVAISGDTAIAGAYQHDGQKGASYVFTCQTNAAPTITGATLARTQGATGPVSTIAAVGDGVGEDAPGSLTVTILSAPAGINVTGITNTTGTITANVAVACNATPGDNIVQLQVQDSGLLTTTANLIVTVTEITLPALPNGIAGTFYTQSAAASPAGVYAYSFAGSLPPGLTLDAGTGLLSGTPTTAGTFNFNVTATGGGCSPSRGYSVVIACPTITLSALPNGLVNTLYSQTITGAPAGTYSFALTSGTLPTGLTLSPAGLLSGTPTQSGNFSFRVTGTGFGTCSGFRDYTLNIGCPVITISPVTLPGAPIGAPYAQVVSASPAGSYLYSVTGGSLPPGVTLDPGTGALTGSPTVAGFYTFTITAASGGCSNSRGYSILVDCPTISLGSLTGGTTGTAYSQSVSASPAGTYGYLVISGSIPLGLTLNTTTGAITGTPTHPGSWIFTIQATQGNCVGTRTYTLVIVCQTFAITTLSLPAATTGANYSQQIIVSPAGSYTYSLSQGNLPPGLTLNATTGVISGIASVPGTSSFVVKAQMANGCSVTQAYSLTVNCPTVIITPATLPGGQIGTAYSQPLSVSPAGIYAFSFTGSLPPGLTLNPVTGLLSGTPTANGTFSFNVTATQSGGCAGSKSYSVTIAPGGCPTITLSSLPSGSKGALYIQYVTASPGGSYSYSLTGTLPPGLTFYSSIGLVYGYPTVAGNFSFSITATNLNGCTGTNAYTVPIAP